MRRAGSYITAIVAAVCLAGPAPLSGQLHEVVKKGDIAQVKSLLTRDNVNSKDDQGATPLMWASAYGKGDIAELLIAQGSDVNATLADGTAALHLAARYGAKNVCETLLRSGVKIDQPLPGNGRTALFIAIMNDQTEVAALLIDHGANVNLKDKTGVIPDSPLSLAAWKGQKDTVKLLLDKGAKDPWLSGVPGFDPLTLAPITPQLDADGNVHVGSMPFFLGRGLAKRPWTQPAASDRSHAGSNLFRWADPDKEKGPLTIMVYEDERQHQTLVAVVPTIFIGDKGVLYPEGQKEVENEGPFVDLVIDPGDLAIEKINIARPDGKTAELTTKTDGVWKTTLQSVSDYEPLTITITPAKGEKPITVDVDCVFRGAKRGTAIYTVKAGV